jgi:hypothetical protein
LFIAAVSFCGKVSNIAKSGGNMTEYAMLLSMSLRGWLDTLYFNYQVWLPLILISAAIVLVVIGLIKPPKI